MNRVIEALLEQAREERAAFGLVFSDTMMRLAAEGYQLSALDADTEPTDD